MSLYVPCCDHADRLDGAEKHPSKWCLGGAGSNLRVTAVAAHSRILFDELRTLQTLLLATRNTLVLQSSIVRLHD